MYQGSKLIDNWLFSFMMINVLWILIEKIHSHEKQTLYRILLLIVILSIPLIARYLWEINIFIPFARLIFAGLLVYCIQYAFKAQQERANLTLEKEQLQSENYKTQLQEITTKIDPHFLFNSLNTLRSMVRQKHPHSESFIVNLSDLYRKMLKHNREGSLPLSDELELLSAYLFLMKTRNEDVVQIEMEIDASLEQRLIPSFALQTVVENCFKHNSMTSKSPLQIEIRNLGNDHIQVRNNLQAVINDDEASGEGLRMLERRYELLAVKDGVTVDQDDKHFSVKLKLLS